MKEANATRTWRYPYTADDAYRAVLYVLSHWESFQIKKRDDSKRFITGENGMSSHSLGESVSIGIAESGDGWAEVSVSSSLKHTTVVNWGINQRNLYRVFHGTEEALKHYPKLEGEENSAPELVSDSSPFQRKKKSTAEALPDGSAPTQTCPCCGSRIPKREHICPVCGTRVKAPTGVTVLIIVLAVVIVLLAGAVYAVRKSDPDNSVPASDSSSTACLVSCEEALLQEQTQRWLQSPPVITEPCAPASR